MVTPKGIKKKVFYTVAGRHDKVSHDISQTVNTFAMVTYFVPFSTSYIIYFISMSMKKCKIGSNSDFKQFLAFKYAMFQVMSDKLNNNGESGI